MGPSRRRRNHERTNHMSLRTTAIVSGLAAALGTGGALAQSYSQSPAPPTQQAPPTHEHAASSKQSVSKAVTPQIMDAQKALKAKDYQGAMAKSKEAQAISDRKPYDDYVINRLITAAAVGLNDMATAAAAAEAAADSPAMPDDEKKVVLHDTLQLAMFQ